jgi:hypothetical protein
MHDIVHRNFHSFALHRAGFLAEENRSAHTAVHCGPMKNARSFGLMTIGHADHAMNVINESQAKSAALLPHRWARWQCAKFCPRSPCRSRLMESWQYPFVASAAADRDRNHAVIRIQSIPAIPFPGICT